jgi:hypothetical protein
MAIFSDSIVERINVGEINNLLNPNKIILGSGTVTYGDNTVQSSSTITLSQVTGAPTALTGFTNNLGNYGNFLTSNNVTYVQMTGSITNTVLTVSVISAGVIRPGNNQAGCPLTTTNTAAIYTNIESQLSGTSGSTGTYQVADARVTGTINNGAALAGTILTVTVVDAGLLADTQKISGTGITAGTTINNQRTSTAAAVTTANFVSGGAVSATTIVLDNVTSVAVGQIVTGTGITGTAATKVTVVNSTTNTITLSAALTVQAAGVYTFLPAGGLGTYTVSVSQLVASTNIKGAFDITSSAMSCPWFTGTGATGGGNNNHEWSQRYLNWSGTAWQILYINCNCNCNC